MHLLVVVRLFDHGPGTGLCVEVPRKGGSKPMIDDITTEQAQAILVVESPHRDEVADGARIPRSGASGRIVSRVLIDVDFPVGRLCQAGKEKRTR